MPSPNNDPVRIDHTRIPQLDWLSVTGLKREAKSERPMIEFRNLPQPPEERAFSIVASAFGLDDQAIDELQPTERNYYASLATAIAQCVIPGPNGEISVPEVDEIIDLDDAADQYGPLALNFLQEFGLSARVKRKRLLGIAGSITQQAFASADDFYEIALKEFTQGNAG